MAKLRYPEAAVEEVDFLRKRGLGRASFLALARCEWIGSGYNLLMTGPTGIGKTWLACALGRRACREGYSVRYIRLPVLFEMLMAAHGDGSFPRVVERLGKKGTVAERIAFLRYARSIGLPVVWSLLHGIPGDSGSEYEETLAILPLLRHLQPPLGFVPLYFER